MGLFDITIENSTLASPPWKFGKPYWASFELYPEWKGNHYYVFRGAAFNEKDYWSETAVVVKTFRHIDGNHGDWCKYSQKCDVSRKMAAMFNKHLESMQCASRVQFVKPANAMMDNISDVMVVTRPIMRFTKRFSTDEVVLFEQLIEGDFKTFVTNTGKTTPEGSYILDAFCHFTYHASDKKLVVCHLKGAEEEGVFTLTNPVIHSSDRCHGDNDKGDTGIANFFKNHICSSLCKNLAKMQTMENVKEPSAPFERSDSHTESKELAAAKFDADDTGAVSPPEYAPNDPYAPPPYAT